MLIARIFCREYNAYLARRRQDHVAHAVTPSRKGTFWHGVAGSHKHAFFIFRAGLLAAAARAVEGGEEEDAPAASAYLADVCNDFERVLRRLGQAPAPPGPAAASVISPPRAARMLVAAFADHGALPPRSAALICSSLSQAVAAAAGAPPALRELRGALEIMLTPLLSAIESDEAASFDVTSLVDHGVEWLQVAAVASSRLLVDVETARICAGIANSLAHLEPRDRSVELACAYVHHLTQQLLASAVVVPAAQWAKIASLHQDRAGAWELRPLRASSFHAVSLPACLRQGRPALR